MLMPDHGACGLLGWSLMQPESCPRMVVDVKTKHGDSYLMASALTTARYQRRAAHGAAVAGQETSPLPLLESQGQAEGLKG